MGADSTPSRKRRSCTSSSPQRPICAVERWVESRATWGLTKSGPAAPDAERPPIAYQLEIVLQLIPPLRPAATGASLHRYRSDLGCLYFRGRWLPILLDALARTFRSLRGGLNRLGSRVVPAGCLSSKAPWGPTSGRLPCRYGQTKFVGMNTPTPLKPSPPWSLTNCRRDRPSASSTACNPTRLTRLMHHRTQRRRACARRSGCGTTGRSQPLAPSRALMNPLAA
jgi:hypothetical protein